MNQSIILDTDSYKSSQWLQYPPGTVRMTSYLESRGGLYNQTVWFGLQILLEKLARGVTKADVDEAEAFFKAHGEPFNKEGWMDIVDRLGGKLPVVIRALDEGMVVPTSIPLMTVESTDEKAYWVVGWLETMLVRLWYPVTVATQSWHIKQVIKAFLKETADDLSGLPFKLHDFGARGVSSEESASIGGAAHLVNFMGSDTVAGVVLANRVYKDPMAAFSIPASEHSTITSWTKAKEVEAYRNMLTQFGGKFPIFACVSDSYDIFAAAEDLWGGTLKDEVVKCGSTVVIRPDSGDPVFVVNTLLHRLERKFGSKLNSKGFRVLNNVRVIQGDGVNEETIKAVLKSAKLSGFSADNIAFGMGGALLQQVNRDTQRFAYKCSQISIASEWALNGAGAGMRMFQDVDVFKDPVTDPGKRSKAGRLGTAVNGGKFEVCPMDAPGNILKPRFQNGELLNTTTLKEVRAWAE
jgi:nicotinamide phosphoribosyltransferase